MNLQSGIFSVAACLSSLTQRNARQTLIGTVGESTSLRGSLGVKRQVTSFSPSAWRTGPVVMAATPWASFLTAVLLLVSPGVHRCSPLTTCPESCTCRSAPLLNCSSAGLSSAPRRLQDAVAELDLSHNLLESVALDRPHRHLRDVRLGNNSIARLSLCVDRKLGGGLVVGRRGRRCVSWAPNLRLLSVERNQLVQLPQGLEGSESLQVLQLSFNRISTLRPEDLSNLRQLKELHLQHNLIASLHPQMFQDLAQLQVLDLSFNALTSLHPLMYLSLRNIRADVQLSGNRWRCDCGMRSLRRRMAYDSSRGLQAWSLACASPATLSGRDLLQLEEEDLNCFSAENGPELHRDVTVYSGSEILLSCAAQDSVWWTPSGQASSSQPQAGLVINDITERVTGLYVCTSEEHEVVSVFNLQISKIEGRKTRSLHRTSRQIIPENTLSGGGQDRNQRAKQSDLTLAVCLSVFITFVIAFILGVLARPCIDVLCRRVTKKKSSAATNSASSVEQRQYHNEAFSNYEDPEHLGTHRERRVTFSTVDFREDSSVKYYDTVATGNQGKLNNEAAFGFDTAEAARDTNIPGDSGSENSLRPSSPEDNQRDGGDLSDITDRTQNKEFEHIPDPVEPVKRRSLSLRSDSSLYDKVFNKDQMAQGEQHSTPKSHQPAEDSLQQRADSTTTKVEGPQISIHGTSEFPVFSSEPFADWSQHTKATNLTDPDLWQETGEQFEFSDSVRSTSARSSTMCSSYDSKLIVAPTSDEQKEDGMSSSCSYVSENEQTQYTVNSDQEEEDMQRNYNACLKQDAGFEQQIHGVDPIGSSAQFNQDDYRYGTQRPAVRPEDSFSSHSSDGENSTVKKVRIPSSAFASQGKILETGALSSPAANTYYSSSESEAEITDLKVNHSAGRVNEGIKISEPDTPSTDLDCQRIPQIKMPVDINAPLKASDSSSSDESMAEIANHTKKQEQGEVDMLRLPINEYQSIRYDTMKQQSSAIDLDNATPIKRRAPLPPADSYSRVESADKTMNHMQKQGETQVTRLPTGVSQTGRHDSDTQWPALDLEDTSRNKRRLDIKAPSPASGSSSGSESEDQTTHHTKRPGKVDIAGPQFQLSQTGSHPGIRWRALDLEHTMRIKRRLDVKPPSPASGSSSSDESMNETTKQTKKQEQGGVNMVQLPISEYQSVNYDTMKPQSSALDLGQTTPTKRRAPLRPADSYSRFESADKIVDHMQKQEETQVARFPIEVSQTGSHDPDTKWPALNLEHIPRVKRRLDVKAPLPASDSSSSSDNEDINQLRKQNPGEMSIEMLPVKVTQNLSHDPQTPWLALDLEDTLRIKRRLDIKTSLPASDSSSSSDNEDETSHHTEWPGKVDSVGPQFQEFETRSDDLDTRWPALDLEHTMRIKRRLDIKAPSQASDSSAGSDSEDVNQLRKQNQGEMFFERLPVEVTKNLSHDPQIQWPALDLEDTLRTKRHLDIKAPMPAFESSSSNDSEDKTTHHTERLGKVGIARPQYQESQKVSHDPRWPARDLEHIPSVKRRLDVKAPSPASDSSFSSDNEDETTHHTERPGKVDIARPQFQESQTESHDPDTRWPALDLEHIPSVKRRLDVKAPSPASDSSFSSDNEDETTHHTERPGKVDIARPQFQKSQTESHDPDTRWPALDLENAMRIKRRLDIKEQLPASVSSSSSDSEEKTKKLIKEQKHGEMSLERLPVKVTQNTSHEPQTQWPALDFEDILRIKRRLDIKAPSSASGSSSSSDREDGTTHHTARPGKVDIARPQFLESQTVSHDPDTRWPALDLEHTMRIKRRLDIKAAFPASGSSSSSDREDKTINQIKEQQHGEMSMARLPVKVTQNASHDAQTQGPALDLDLTMHIKRRLDIKAPSPPSSSGGSTNHTVEGKKGEAIKMSPCHLSSSSDEQGVHVEDLRYPRTTLESNPHLRLPGLDLNSAFRVKKRLDIKAPSTPSETSSSSDREGESEGWTTNLPVEVERDRPDLGISSYQPGRKLSGMNVSVPSVKRRLNIKGPSQQMDSCSSNSDNESRHSSHTVKHEREQGYVGITDREQQTKLHKLSPGVHYINRRLDIKAPSPQPDQVLGSVSPGSRQSESNPSRSDSEDEYGDHAKIGLGVSAISKATDKEFIQSPKTPVINMSHSPKTDHDIILKKYTVIDEVGDKTTGDSISTTPEINPELQSRWATMNLGVSRFRKRLEITSHTREPPDLPSSPPPDSPSSSSSESRTGSKTSRARRKRRGVEVHTEPSLTTENKPVNVSLSLKGRDDNSDNSVEVTAEEKPNPNQTRSMVQRTAEVELKSQTSKVGEESLSLQPHLSLTNIPHIRKALDIKASLQRESFSSSEVEMLGHSIPDLSLSVPRVKRRLNVKTLLPEPSNSPPSCSDSENEVTGYTENQSRLASNMSGMTDDDSLITYKRVIIKTSLPSNSFSPTSKGQTIDHTKQRHMGATMPTVAQEGQFHSMGDKNAYLTPKKVSSMSFEDVVKRRIEQPGCTTDMDLPPTLRWTGIGRQLSDLSIPSTRRQWDVGLAYPPAEPDLPPPDSSRTESDDNTKQNRGKAEATLTPEHPSLASGRAPDKLDNPPSSQNEVFKATSEDRSERKGLSALKAMSSERRRWETLDDKGTSSLFDDRVSQGDTSFNYRRSEKDVDKQPLTQLHLSSTSVERRATDSLYGIPRYRRHDFGGVEPPQGAPPPIPATPPPPYEAVGRTLRSPQSRNTEKSNRYSLEPQNLAVNFDSPNVNISEV